VVWRAAERFGLHGVWIHASPAEPVGYPSDWILLSKESEWLSPAPVAQVAKPLQASLAVRMWTDDYSNLFQILK
jgi:hypothetical protein